MGFPPDGGPSMPAGMISVMASRSPPATTASADRSPAAQRAPACHGFPKSPTSLDALTVVERPGASRLVGDFGKPWQAGDRWAAGLRSALAVVAGGDRLVMTLIIPAGIEGPPSRGNPICPDNGG